MVPDDNMQGSNMQGSNMPDKLQPHLLVGARALHALSAGEAAQFDRHLAGCDSCAEELKGFRETLALVGSHTPSTPRPALRATVLRTADITPQLPPPTVEPAPGGSEVLDRTAGVTKARGAAARRRHRSPRLLLAAAAVAVAIIAGAVAFGVTGGQNGTSEADMMHCVEQATDAHVLSPDVGSRGAVTMAPSCHAAVVQPAGLPAPPSGMVYQLWVMTGAQARSMGMMHDNAAGAMPMMVAATRSGDTAIDITVEPAGGSERPTSDPVWRVDLPT